MNTLEAVVDRPELDYGDALVRAALSAVISTTFRPRLLKHAERCLGASPREGITTAEDLVECALVLLLVGKLRWRGSLNRMLATLNATIRNLSLHARRFARKFEPLDAGMLKSLRLDDDSDRKAWRVLLQSNVHVVLGELPEGQRRAVGCVLDERRERPDLC